MRVGTKEEITQQTEQAESRHMNNFMMPSVKPGQVDKAVADLVQCCCVRSLCLPFAAIPSS